jgi:hypothetical protein
VKIWRPLIAEDAEAGHAVVVGAVNAMTIKGGEGVARGAVVVGASKEVRRKDAGKAPQPAGPSYFLYLPPLAAPDIVLRGAGVGSTNLAPISVASMARTSFASLPGSSASQVSIAHRRQWRSWPRHDPGCLSEVPLRGASSSDTPRRGYLYPLACFEVAFSELSNT